MAKNAIMIGLSSEYSGRWEDCWDTPIGVGERASNSAEWTLALKEFRNSGNERSTLQEDGSEFRAK